MIATALSASGRCPSAASCLVGARDLDPPEEAYLAGSAITTCAVTDLERTPLPEGPLYVHVDMDVTDPADLPGLRYPAPAARRWPRWPGR